MVKFLSHLLILLCLSSVCQAQTITDSVSKQIQAATPTLLEQTREAGLSVVLIENCAATWHGDFGAANTG